MTDTDGLSLDHTLTELRVGGVTLPNRIMMSPMCQHRASSDGAATDWHLVHYGSRAAGGVGLIMIEDCAVSPEGRLSSRGLGLYDDDQIEPLARIVDYCHSVGAVVGLQLGHAGRKAFGPDGPPPGVSLLAPTAEPFDTGRAAPSAMTSADGQGVVEAFGSAAERAVRAGFDVLEVHGAHGYLLHQTLASPGLAPDVADLLHRVVRRVRSACPESVALFTRISVGGGVPGDVDVAEAVELAARLGADGVDVLDVSSGGLTGAIVGDRALPQPDVAAALRKATGMPTIGVGGVSRPAQAESLLAAGACDIVAVGRALLDNPYWLAHARAAAVTPVGG